MLKTDKTLDIKGLVSARAEIVTKNTLASMESGQVLTVVTTCCTVKQKMASLCDSLGCTLLEIKEEAGMLHIRIQK